MSSLPRASGVAPRPSADYIDGELYPELMAIVPLLEMAETSEQVVATLDEEFCRWFVHDRPDYDLPSWRGACCCWSLGPWIWNEIQGARAGQ